MKASTLVLHVIVVLVSTPVAAQDRLPSRDKAKAQLTLAQASGQISQARITLCKWWESPVRSDTGAQGINFNSLPKTRVQVMRELEEARASGEQDCLVNVHGD